MLKIGDFSRLSQIGIHALRNYDKIGLLQSEHVDQFTGYRYYTLNQLPRAHRIMALKEMGLSLEQIGIMLNQDMSMDELRGMFRLKQAEIEQRVREDQQRLTMIEFHLRMIELEGKMPELDVVVKDLSSFRALYFRFQRTSSEDTPRYVREVFGTLDKGNILPNNPIASIMYGDEINADEEDWGMAFVIPVDDSIDHDIPLPTSGNLKVIDIPAVKVATLIYKGTNRVAGLEKRTLLRQWALQNGYELLNETRLVHIVGGGINDVPHDEWITEFQIVVEEPDENNPKHL